MSAASLLGLLLWRDCHDDLKHESDNEDGERAEREKDRQVTRCFCHCKHRTHHREADQGARDEAARLPNARLPKS